MTSPASLGMSHPRCVFSKAGLSQRDAAALLGNCMSGNVLQLILPAVLYAGGIIGELEYKGLDKMARQQLSGSVKVK